MIRRHWDRVADLGCAISRAPEPTIHHCHGASMLDLPWDNPGMGEKQNDWLVIPLAEKFHTGDYGIDRGMGLYGSPIRWEAKFGRQVDFLIWVSERLDYSLFERAGVDFKWA